MEVGPEHVDDGLARFRYAFSDGGTYHLNMFPLRHGYVRRLMREVGFQKIGSYGDYQLGHDNPDFYVHVAEKEYRMDTDQTAYELGNVLIGSCNVAADYYDDSDADRFYAEVWGGEDIHIGLYASSMSRSLLQAGEPSIL